VPVLKKLTRAFTVYSLLDVVPVFTGIQKIVENDWGETSDARHLLATSWSFSIMEKRA
jgi:hypothetical protein